MGPEYLSINPRTSLEVRPLGIYDRLDDAVFQSTHLFRGATAHSLTVSCSGGRFQSTHLFRGATAASDIIPATFQFQSTHLFRGATKYKEIFPINVKISIHAPQSGCDGAASRLAVSALSFQSTHPNRGATKLKKKNLT